MRQRQEEKMNKEEEDDMVNLMNIDEEGCLDDNHKIFSNQDNKNFTNFNDNYTRANLQNNQISISSNPNI